MSAKIIRPAEHIQNTWSGGVSTQIAIYPENANYAERDFIWRISSAVIKDTASQFTPLPGYARKIMILEGNVFLSHEGHHESHLGRFDTDSFSGSWRTTSTGTGTDFNLIYKEKYEGSLLHRQIPNGVRKIFPGKFDTTAIYCAGGKVELIVEGRRYLLSPREMLLINEEISEITAKNTQPEPAELIIASVKK